MLNSIFFLFQNLFMQYLIARTFGPHMLNSIFFYSKIFFTQCLVAWTFSPHMLNSVFFTSKYFYTMFHHSDLQLSCVEIAVVPNEVKNNYRLLVEVFGNALDFLKASDCTHSIEQLFDDILE